MLLFGSGISNGEAYDLLTLSELISFLLAVQIAHLQTIQRLPPGRSDLQRAEQEARQSK